MRLAPPEIPPFRSSPCGGDRTGAIPPRTREREIVRTSSIKTFACRHPDGTPGVISYGVQYLNGNHDAYFTVTAYFKGFDLRGHHSEFGGCCHDDILQIRPDLKPLVDLHLSDEETGQPMHLYANAESHAGIGKWSKFAPRWLAEHLRISDEAADDLANAGDRNKLREFIDSQLTRYRNEARAAIAQFGLRTTAERSAAQ